MPAFRLTLRNTWIKICGITRSQDASAAAELGADAIGLVFFAKSPRAVTVQDVAEIVQDLPRSLEVVALFVNPDKGLVQEVVDTGHIDLLQFHGSESAAFCEQFSRPYMKAIAVKDESQLASEIESYSSAKYILLDSYDPGLPGGTGKTFDWEKVEAVAESQKSRLVLAGGLTPDNVQTAIKEVRPFGVDVSSGVEARKGIKDFGKIKSFIEGVKVSDNA